MCICINCIYVHDCSTYEQIRKQHNKLKTVINKKFEAADPIVYVNISNFSDATNIDWDIIECLSFVEKPGYWVI
uniref:hypothetical protein ycf34 n=1 Tax=Nemalion vermiculare TaxID=935621 RepID=UPI00257FAF63|nr:hypothetical protein ycf34 [Nemalion vermiculare]WGV34465.1 hypothetical protein ycf34 [Nemalion vermiculare]